ncbi:MAG: helix-turn-helix domain-containing protein [Erysipelotrichales bacterium]|nr:helix-turn-helix domain-containing protein [Erysipelotrichales bacterium]
MSSSNVLAQRRKELGISQSKIADVLGYSVQTISKWETGKSFPDLPIWGELAKVLQIDLDALINDKIKTNYNNVCFDNIFSAEKFSSNLRKQRKIRDETQKQLADKLGISYQTLLAWEKCMTFPNVEQFKIISKVLNISYDDLYFANNSLVTYSPKKRIEKVNQNSKNKSTKKVRLFSALIISFVVIISVTISAIILNNKFGTSYTASLPALNEQSSVGEDNNSLTSDDDLLGPVGEVVNLPFNDEYIIARMFYDSELPLDDKRNAIVNLPGEETYFKSKGIDFVFEKNTDILAAIDGTVIKIEMDYEVYGNVVWIQHEKGIISIYASLSEVNVNIDQELVQGDIIGKSGVSLYTQEVGIETLHFEMVINDNPININNIFGKPVDSLF